MFNETLKPSSKPTTTSIGTFLDMPMTKIEMLLSQSKTLTTIANKLEANVEYQKVPLKAKVDANIEEKNTFKIGNLKTTRECGMITNAKFKARVKKLLDYKCKFQG
jgi:hypothetical protein